MKALENFTVLTICVFFILFSQPTASAQISKSIKDDSKIKTIENYKVNPQTGDKTHVSSEHFDDHENLIKRLQTKRKILSSKIINVSIILLHQSSSSLAFLKLVNKSSTNSTFILDYS